MADLVDHLESSLGRITGGSQGDATTPDGVQVCWFPQNSPFEGAVTLVTLGLSNHHLNQASGQGIHQELLLHLPARREPRNAGAVLFQVAQILIERGQGLRRGEVLGPYGRLFAGSAMTALYAAAPAYLPDGFGKCETPRGPVFIVWLIPITDPEVAYVRDYGWHAFEETLVAEDPDLTDPGRPPIAAAGELS